MPTPKQIQRVQELERIAAELTKVDRKRIKELDTNIKALTINLDKLNVEFEKAEREHRQKALEIKSLEQMGRIKAELNNLEADSGAISDKKFIEEQSKALEKKLKQQEENFKLEMETEAGKAYRKSQENLETAKRNYEKNKPKKAEIQEKIYFLKEELKKLRQMASLNNSPNDIAKRCVEKLSTQFKPSDSNTNPETVLESAVKYSLIRLTGAKDSSEKKIAKNQCLAAGWKMGFGPSKAITAPPPTYKKSGLNMAKIDEIVFSTYTEALKKRIENRTQIALDTNEPKPEKVETRKETDIGIRKKPLLFAARFSETGHSSTLVSKVFNLAQFTGLPV